MTISATPTSPVVVLYPLRTRFPQHGRSRTVPAHHSLHLAVSDARRFGLTGVVNFSLILTLASFVSCVHVAGKVAEPPGLKVVRHYKGTTGWVFVSKDSVQWLCQCKDASEAKR